MGLLIQVGRECAAPPDQPNVGVSLAATALFDLPVRWSKPSPEKVEQVSCLFKTQAGSLCYL